MFFLGLRVQACVDVFCARSRNVVVVVVAAAECVHVCVTRLSTCASVRGVCPVMQFNSFGCCYLGGCCCVCVCPAGQEYV